MPKPGVVDPAFANKYKVSVTCYKIKQNITFLIRYDLTRVTPLCKLHRFLNNVGTMEYFKAENLTFS